MLWFPVKTVHLNSEYTAASTFNILILINFLKIFSSKIITLFCDVIKTWISESDVIKVHRCH